jgi:nucleoside-diphosphate-sugar epimerase
VKWLLAGASGFLGTAIRVRLASEGQPVVRLVRREPATSTEFRWDPDSGEIDLSAFDGVAYQSLRCLGRTRDDSKSSPHGSTPLARLHVALPLKPIAARVS